MTSNEMALMANIAVDMQKNEVNAVLDKIRDEIANEKGTFPKEHYIRIIDKYKAESEVRNDY